MYVRYKQVWWLKLHYFRIMVCLSLEVGTLYELVSKIKSPYKALHSPIYTQNLFANKSHIFNLHFICLVYPLPSKLLIIYLLRPLDYLIHLLKNIKYAYIDVELSHIFLYTTINAYILYINTKFIANKLKCCFLAAE